MKTTHIVIKGVDPFGKSVDVDVELDEGSITINGHCQLIGGCEPMFLAEDGPTPAEIYARGIGRGKEE